MSDFELRRALKDLPRERDPRADLWPGIAARLGAQAAPVATPARRPAPRWIAIAATVTVALGATWLGLRTQGPSDTRQVRDGSGWSLAQADAMAESYRGAMAASLGGEHRAELARYLASPDVLAAERELDAAQRELQQALRADPNSVYLLDLLRQTHEQRARLYRPALAIG
jgi:hypothetical protein